MKAIKVISSILLIALASVAFAQNHSAPLTLPNGQELAAGVTIVREGNVIQYQDADGNVIAEITIETVDGVKIIVIMQRSGDNWTRSTAQGTLDTVDSDDFSTPEVDSTYKPSPAIAPPVEGQSQPLDPIDPNQEIPHNNRPPVV